MRTSVLVESFAPARVYAYLGSISLLLLTVLVPPFQVPDEPQHFNRSYQLSRLEIWPDRQGDFFGGEVPDSVAALVERFLGTNLLHTDRRLTTQRLSETLAELDRPLEPEITVFAVFDTSKYAPLAYVPQALAIAAGRALAIGPLGLLYLARMANALVAWTVTCLALQAFGTGARFALAAALLPMSQFMMASCSPDALTIAGSFAFVAVLSRFLSDHAWPSVRQWAAFVSGVVMCSIKAVLSPLLACGLAALFGRGLLTDVKLRRAAILQLAAAFLTVALIGAWSWSVGGLSGSQQPRPGVNIAVQAAQVIGHPGNSLGVVFASLYDRTGFLWTSMIGIFGWLTLPLPIWTYWLAAIAFALSLYAEPPASRISNWSIAYLALLIAGSVILTELVLYVVWTPVDAPIVEGVQGRYFIPLLPLAGFCLASVLPSERQLLQADVAYLLLLVLLVIATVTMQWTIVAGYGLLPSLPHAPAPHHF